MEDSFLRDLIKPLFFDAAEFGRALERYDESNPHQTTDTLDSNNKPLVDGPLYNITRGEPGKVDSKSAADFPDISDEIMSDYAFRRLMGEEIELPKFVDLDTAEDYVQFTKNSIGSALASEQEFETGSDVSTQTNLLLSDIKKLMPRPPVPPE